MVENNQIIVAKEYGCRSHNRFFERIGRQNRPLIFCGVTAVEM